MLKNKRGFTLIETILVIAISAIIIGAATTVYSSLSQKQDAKDLIMDVYNVQNFIESMYQDGTDMDGVNSATLHALGFNTAGFIYDPSIQEYRHKYIPRSGFSGGNMGEVHISVMPYRLTKNNYQIRISGVKGGYVCSEVARKIKKNGKFTEIQIAGTTLNMGAANSITDNIIDTTCRTQQIVSMAFLKDNYY